MERPNPGYFYGNGVAQDDYSLDFCYGECSKMIKIRNQFTTTWKAESTNSIGLKF